MKKEKEIIYNKKNETKKKFFLTNKEKLNALLISIMLILLNIHQMIGTTFSFNNRKFY